MKQSEQSKLLDKFWNGDTSLEEENILKNSDIESDESDKVYFHSLQQKTNLPVNLENEIWSSIESKSSISKFRITPWLVAASLTLMVGISSVVFYQKRQIKIEQEFALIEETLMHVSGELNNNAFTEVLYQDSYITIVAEN